MTAICLPARSRTFDDLRGALVRFVSEPASTLPLAVLRIGLALLLLWQALALAPYLGDLFGSKGLVQSDVADRLTPVCVAHLTWVSNSLAPLGVSESGALPMVFAMHL